jgi:D-ribose pyranase
LNREVSEVIASMGHMDTLVVSDAGLPIPEHVRRIDLAVSGGIPAFLDVVKAIESELKVQRIVVAEEMEQISPRVRKALDQLFPGIPGEQVPHEQFKTLCKNARAVVRTGECTPYANVILESGVIF